MENSENQILVGRTSNGIEVYERTNSHRKSAHKVVTDELLAEALEKASDDNLVDTQIDKNGKKRYVYCVNLGRTIGKNTCREVELNNQEDAKKVFMAKT